MSVEKVPEEPNHTRLRAVGQSLTAYRKVRYLLRPRHAQVCWELLRPSGRHRLARLHHLQGGVVIHCYRTSHSFGVDGGSLYTDEPRAVRSSKASLARSQERQALHCRSLRIIRPRAGQELGSITGSTLRCHYRITLPIIRPRAGQELESITESALRAHYR